MKKIIYLLLILIINSCWPCDTVTIENGPLPDSALSFIPYQDNQVYKLKHTNGFIINFETVRSTAEEWTHCTECCSNEYHYEVNTTRMTPDYPVFDLYFYISNRDTTYFDCYASIGKYGFYIPTSDLQSDYFEKADSLMIDSTIYNDVYKLKSDYGSYYDNDSIYADSMYYNYKYGILKILMSNGESYEIVR